LGHINAVHIAQQLAHPARLSALDLAAGDERADAARTPCIEGAHLSWHCTVGDLERCERLDRLCKHQGELS
jgi:hypothetical protein